MRKKKPSLADALGKSSTKLAENSESVTKEQNSDDFPIKPKSNVAPSRVNKKAVTGFFDPEVSKQLKLIAIEREETIQSLLVEAINDIFKKYGKSPIAN